MTPQGGASAVQLSSVLCVGGPQWAMQSGVSVLFKAFNFADEDRLASLEQSPAVMAPRRKPSAARPAPETAPASLHLPDPRQFACFTHQLGVDSLPDEVLGSIFACLGRSAGPALSLVCRHWYRVLYSPAAAGFWGEYTVDGRALQAPTLAGQARVAEWARHKLQHLERVSPCVRSFFLRDTMGSLTAALRAVSPGWQPAQALAALRPAALSSIGLALNPFSEQALPAAELQRLSRFERLESLQLITMQLQDSHAQQLTALSQLRRLRCCIAIMPASLLPAVVTLRQLTCLELESVQPPPGALSQLTSLACLQRLVIHVEGPGSADGLQAPPLARLPALRSFNLRCDMGIKIASAHMASCCYSADERAPMAGLGGTGDAPMGQLSLASLTSIKSLDDLLTSLLPPAAPFQILRMEHCQLPAAAVGPCLRLAPLRMLRLHYLRAALAGGAAAGGLDAALGALLHQASSLAALELYGPLRPFPLSLVGLRGLQWLRLRQNYLERLPSGAFLEDLTYLDFGDNNGSERKQLPASLSACQRLEHLDLSKNSKIPIRQCDLDTVLAMPRLRKLSLGVRPSIRVRQRLLDEASPGLELVQP